MQIYVISPKMQAQSGKYEKLLIKSGVLLITQVKMQPLQAT